MCTDVQPFYPSHALDASSAPRSNFGSLPADPCSLPPRLPLIGRFYALLFPLKMHPGPPRGCEHCDASQPPTDAIRVAFIFAFHDLMRHVLASLGFVSKLPGHGAAYSVTSSSVWGNVFGSVALFFSLFFFFFFKDCPFLPWCDCVQHPYLVIYSPALFKFLCRFSEQSASGGTFSVFRKPNPCLFCRPLIHQDGKEPFKATLCYRFQTLPTPQSSPRGLSVSTLHCVPGYFLPRPPPYS